MVCRDDPLSSDIKDQSQSGLYLQLCFAIGHEGDDLESSKELSPQNVELSTTDVIRFDPGSLHLPSKNLSFPGINGLNAKGDESRRVWGLDTCSYRATFHKSVSLRAVECSERSSHSFLSDISFLNDSINCFPLLQGDKDSRRSVRSANAASPQFAKLGRKTMDKTKAKRRPLWSSSLAANESERYKSSSSRRPRVGSAVTLGADRGSSCCPEDSEWRASSSLSCSGLERRSTTRTKLSSAAEVASGSDTNNLGESHFRAGWRIRSSASSSGIEREREGNTPIKKSSPSSVPREAGESRTKSGWRVGSSASCSGIEKHRKKHHVSDPAIVDVPITATARAAEPTSAIAPKQAGKLQKTRNTVQQGRGNLTGRDSHSVTRGSNGLLARAKRLSSRSLAGRRSSDSIEAGENPPSMSRGNSSRSIQSLSVSSLQDHMYQSGFDIDARGCSGMNDESTRNSTHQNADLRKKKNDDMSTRRGRRLASSLIGKTFGESRSIREWRSPASCDGKDNQSCKSTSRSTRASNPARNQSEAERDDSSSHRLGRRSVTSFDPVRVQEHQVSKSKSKKQTT